tara:strand:+ start:401 stop:733 length:333 start_codon:yes stop_codon:yes gene_type:complete
MIKTNLNTCYKTANYFNKMFFEIPRKHINFILVDIPEWGNFCEGHNGDVWIEMGKTYPNYNLFKNVLVHELVHMYQWLYPDPVDKEDHGPSFFKWNKYLTEHGVVLEETY